MITIAKSHSLSPTQCGDPSPRWTAMVRSSSEHTSQNGSSWGGARAARSRAAAARRGAARRRGRADGDGRVDVVEGGDRDHADVAVGCEGAELRQPPVVRTRAGPPQLAGVLLLAARPARAPPPSHGAVFSFWSSAKSTSIATPSWSISFTRARGRRGLPCHRSHSARCRPVPRGRVEHRRGLGCRPALDVLGEEAGERLAVLRIQVVAVLGCGDADVPVGGGDEQTLGCHRWVGHRRPEQSARDDMCGKAEEAWLRSTVS